MAAFVPAAIGVQEAGYAMLAPLFGLPAEMGVAVSLLKRAREIALGVPALLYWQAWRAGGRLAGGLHERHRLGHRCFRVCRSAVARAAVARGFHVGC